MHGPPPPPPIPAVRKGCLQAANAPADTVEPHACPVFNSFGSRPHNGLRRASPEGPFDFREEQDPQELRVDWDTQK